jgi:hypothetical protein
VSKRLAWITSNFESPLSGGALVVQLAATRRNKTRAGKAAVTHWRVIDRRDDLTLVEFTPETGRRLRWWQPAQRHQLARVPISAH